jgi:endonuclease III
LTEIEEEGKVKMGNHQNIVSELIRRGTEALNNQREPVQFTTNDEANMILNNIDQYPHIFVLGCIADRQMPSEQAWLSAYQFCREVVPANRLLTFENIENNIQPGDGPLNVNHRFHNRVANGFIQAIRRIRAVYQGNAEAIWAENPVCSSVVSRLLEFNGIGLKIANMGTNILLRDFKIFMQNKATIDMPVDGNVLRVFKRLGFVPETTLKKEVAIYKAKALYPDYPAVFDKGVWEIGKNWCHARRQPNCANCYMSNYCIRQGVN